MPLRMTPEARSAYRAERDDAAAATEPTTVWWHLERAHILAQPFAAAHVGSHLAMFRQGLRDRDAVEVAGQALRVVVAAPPSLLSRYPTGNTGRARVPLRAEMPVPDDIAELLTDHGAA